MNPAINYQLYYERYKQALKECLEISMDSTMTNENRIIMIRDVSRSYLDGEPTTADEYNNNHLKKIKDIMSWDDKDIDEKYWEVYEYINDQLNLNLNNTIDSIKATTQVIKMTPEYKVGKRIVFGEETEVDADYRDVISDIEAQDSYKCEHENKTYQAEEKDTNVPESYICDDCGRELELPEPDEDILRDR